MSDTTTQTLADWLLACIAEDEAVVRSCLERRAYHKERSRQYRAEHPDWYPPERMAELDAAEEPEPDWYENDEYDHLCARPAHVLAVCAAYRAIVAEHSAGIDPEHGCAPRFSGNPWWTDADPCPTLRALALAYADRPGFREEWRA